MIKEKELFMVAAEPKLICQLCSFLDCNTMDYELSTTGNEQWWDDIIDCKGWKIQQNRLSGYCKIIDPNNYSKAWGTESSMLRAIKIVLEINQKETYKCETKDMLNILEKLGELRNKGFILEEEFVEKKNIILSQI